MATLQELLTQKEALEREIETHQEATTVPKPLPRSGR